MPPLEAPRVAAGAFHWRHLRHDPLFNLVRLFELRNAVAHKGEIISESDARDVVRGAVDAAAWLDGL